MTKDELNKIKSACDDFSNFFRNCLDHEMMKICREYELDKSFLMILKKYKSSKREIQEEWVNYNIMQFATTKVFTQNGNFDKFFKNSYLNTLKPEEKEKLFF